MDFSSITFSFFRIRIQTWQQAKNLLTYSDYTLGEISNYLNFSSQSYFTIVFKKITGTTPGNYRRIHKQHTW